MARSKLFGFITNTEEPPQFDDILNSGLNKDEMLQAIQERGQAYNDDLDMLLNRELNTERLKLGLELGGSLIGGLGLFRAGKLAAPYAPYLDKIWKGRSLLFHKPFENMTPQEYNEFGRRGVKFYKEVLNPTQTTNKNVDNAIRFPNASAGESDYRYMEQYPLLPKNIKEAQENTYIPPQPKIKNGKPYIRKDAKGFHNLKVKWKDKYYDYQIRDNAYDDFNDFHNIKPYENLYDYLNK